MSGFARSAQTGDTIRRRTVGTRSCSVLRGPSGEAKRGKQRDGVSLAEKGRSGVKVPSPWGQWNKECAWRGQEMATAAWMRNED